jgi:hypothetical protein
LKILEHSKWSLEWEQEPKGNLVQPSHDPNGRVNSVNITWEPTCETLEFHTVTVLANHIYNKFLFASTAHTNFILFMWFSPCSLEDKCILHGVARSALVKIVKAMPLMGEEVNERMEIMLQVVVLVMKGKMLEKDEVITMHWWLCRDTIAI